MIKIGFVSYDKSSEIIIKDAEMVESVTIVCDLTDEQIESLDKMLGMCVYSKAEPLANKSFNRIAHKATQSG